ncbi:hypothetical protein OS175_02185 [Marinicella sp. S1101]|uniref:hypothetical protein n=1 Tax=Marinicella marina TaxID=2996016 RepID=UPI002260BA2D|nr:hypothetical protein [Marinicella marina]MCX7552674.1 hypothetical protein [Marinicella marina]MDJ1139550.1 hypothetical protein [Marinicella marina]
MAAVMAYSVADDNFEMPDHLVVIDLETGEYESRGKIADPYIALEGLAISPSGVLFGADDNTKTLVQINTNEARAFPVNNVNQNLGFGAIPASYDFGMTFSCDDKLHMVVKDTQELYEVNASTGEASLIGNTGHNFTSLAAWGDDLYSIASGEFTLYKVDKTTAEATVVGELGDLGGDIELAGSGMAFDESGDLWMVVNLRLSDPLNPFPSRVFKINTTTGEATLVSETLVGIESLAISGPGGCEFGPGGVQPVPVDNPFSLLLLILAMMGVSAFTLQRSSI